MAGEETAVSSAMRWNLITADDAAQKQCRRASAVGPNPMVPMNSGQLMFTFPTCDGPRCCHWRWHLVPPKSEMANGSQPLGCCGLAGSP